MVRWKENFLFDSAKLLLPATFCPPPSILSTAQKHPLNALQCLIFTGC